MANFQRVKIKDHCEITSSKRIFADEYLTSGVPFYRGKEISEKQRSSAEVSDLIYISRDKFEEIKAKYGVPQKGDLLLTSVGTIGNPYLVKDSEEFYFKDGNLTWFRNFQGIDGQWLYYWLLSPQGKSELNKCTIGSSQKAYTINLLYGLQIELPNLSTQTRIAGVLAGYDDLIENNEKRIKALEEMAQLLYTEWFVKFNFPASAMSAIVETQNLASLPTATNKIKLVDSHTEYGMIPEGWEVKRLGDVADLIMGQSPTSNNYNLENQGIPFHQGVADFGYKYPIDRVYSTAGNKFAENADLLFSVRAPVGRMNIANKKIILGRGLSAIRHKKGYQSLLYLMFANKFTEKDMIGNGAIYKSVNKIELENLKFVVPTDEIEKKFEEIVSMYFQEMAKITLLNKNLSKTRDLLIPQLVTGKRELK